MIFSRKISHFSHKNTFFSCYVLQIWKKSCNFAAQNAAEWKKCSIMETKETKQEQTKHKSLWELAKEWKGNLTVNDPVFLL